MVIIENLAGTAGTAESTEICALGSRPSEWERLRRQCEELRPNAEFLIGQVTLKPDQEVVDFGCGPGGVLDFLAERVGPFGHVLGIDADPTNVAQARSFRNTLGLANVTIEKGELACSGLEGSSYDLAHARLVLHRCGDPVAVVREMARVVRPGGWVVSAEADHICPRVPEFFAQAGLVDVGFDTRIEWGFFMTWGRKP
jgi:SAM-dependent methyltransferase